MYQKRKNMNLEIIVQGVPTELDGHVFHKFFAMSDEGIAYFGWMAVTPFSREGINDTDAD
jgi:hypothetical protein